MNNLLSYCGLVARISASEKESPVLNNPRGFNVNGFAYWQYLGGRLPPNADPYPAGSDGPEKKFGRLMADMSKFQTISSPPHMCPFLSSMKINICL